jgi:hypothetical protein
MAKPNMNPKDFLKKVSFLWSNLSLLVPVLIAVVALLLFIPTRILGGKLRSTIEKTSGQAGRTISSLMNQLDDAARARRLEPYINAYARDANQIEAMMKQTTLRELLSYRIFPDTNERTTLLYEEFSRNYRSGIDEMLRSVKAGAPPTESETTTALRSAPQQSLYGSYGGAYGSGPARPSTLPQSQGSYGRGAGVSSYMMTETQRKIFDTICLDKARSAGVYAGPVDIAGYVYWADWKFEERDAAYKDCWYWQMGYWMAEDVMTTIREMNKGSSSVLDAPVKRLMNVSFVFGRTTGRGLRRPGRGGFRGKKEGENPAYVTSAKDGLTNPCTGRSCSEELDVMHFNVRVVVDAKDAMSFMKQLCIAKEHTFRGWKGGDPAQRYLHNQITILESSTAPVDPQDFDHDAYRYGDAPAVELDLICEYLFDKPAYESMKPQQVKDDIISASEPANKRR